MKHNTYERQSRLESSRESSGAYMTRQTAEQAEVDNQLEYSSVPLVMRNEVVSQTDF